MALIPSKLVLLTVFSILPYTIFTQNIWLYPDPKTNPVYNYIDILNASWTTTFDSSQLILWCTANAGEAYGQTPQGCHFDIHAKKGSGENQLNSGNFNIQIESSSSTVTWSPTNPTSSAASSSKTSSAASQTFRPAATTSAYAPPASDTGSSNSGLSPAANAGIGVGAAGGVIAVVAGLLFWLRSRRRQKQSQVATYEESMEKEPGLGASGKTASNTHTAPIEVDGKMLNHEMPGNSIAQTKFVGELEGSGTKGGPIGTAR